MVRFSSLPLPDDDGLMILEAILSEG